MLEAVNLTKVYPWNNLNLFSSKRVNPPGVVAVKEVSLSIGRGEYIAIVGPSGAGKSTLLHILGGLDLPTQGRVIFEGEDIYKMKERELTFWRNKTVGFVFQFYHLIEELNVLENILIANYRDKPEISLKKAKGLLKYLGLEERERFFPSQLSGGEKQRVAIARALINEPQVLLCDEPTGNLDLASQDRVIKLLEDLNTLKKKTVILVTHNLELARRAHRMFFMQAGEIKLS